MFHLLPANSFHRGMHIEAVDFFSRNVKLNLPTHAKPIIISNCEEALVEKLPDASVSYWIDSTPDTNYPALQQDIEVDVAVIGAGIAGLTTALLLQRAGRSVAVLEAGRIVKGVTGYTTAKVTSQHHLIYDRLISQFGESEARAYANANQAGLELIAKWVESEKIACDFRRRSAYVYAVTEREVPRLQAEAKAAARLGLPAGFTKKTSLPFPILGAVEFTNQAEFHPRKFLLALASRFTEAGGRIFEETPALDVKDGSLCKVATAQGRLAAKEVVITSHFPLVDPALYFARMWPKRSYALGIRIQDPEPEGMFISAESPIHSLRSHPTERGEMLIVVGEGHKVGQGGDILARYQRLEAFAERHFKVLSVDYRWSTQDNIPIDGVPFIGKLGLFSKHLHVATGFQSWGMTNGAAAALILSDQILGRENPWGKLFNPNRFTPLASAKNFFLQNLDNAKHYIADRLKSAPEQDPETLAAGQGRILKWQGKKIAACKDKDGKLHTLSPVCTHMKCIVDWNNAEQSWDCPCHGSRFDCEGKVLHGPASKPLNPLSQGASDDSRE